MGYPLTGSEHFKTSHTSACSNDFLSWSYSNTSVCQLGGEKTLELLTFHLSKLIESFDEKLDF